LSLYKLQSTFQLNSCKNNQLVHITTIVSLFTASKFQENT